MEPTRIVKSSRHKYPMSDLDGLGPRELAIKFQGSGHVNLDMRRKLMLLCNSRVKNCEGPPIGASGPRDQRFVDSVRSRCTIPGGPVYSRCPDI